MKLLYKNIVVGNLRNLSCDMYREGGALDLVPASQRENSELSVQLYEWIEVNTRLEELELECSEEEYKNSPEVEKLWELRSQLPDFENHSYWMLLNEESGKTEQISSPRFSRGGAGWFLPTPKATKEKKDFSAIIGLLAGLILVVIWFYIKRGGST